MAAALLLLTGCGSAAEVPAISPVWTPPVPVSVNIPILLYHHIDDTGGESAVISEASFRHQMDILAESGYTPVSFEALIAYVNSGERLPEKPVCITFDDGYLSTYEVAFPILGDHGFPGTVFVIGSSVGHTEHYKDTAWPITPHFGIEAMGEMAASGRMAVQSHTYDMHQYSDYEDTDTPRTSILPLDGESEADYIAALTADFRLEETILGQGGVDGIQVLAFPKGYHTDLTDEVLADLGVQVTLTTDQDRVNTVTQGQPQSLYSLGRLNMTDDITDEDLLAYLTQ